MVNIEETMYYNKKYLFLEYYKGDNNNNDDDTNDAYVEKSISETSQNNYITPDGFDNFVISAFNPDNTFKGRNSYSIPDEDSF